MPAAASSALAFSRSCWRWATLVSVEGKTGANGLSLPRSAFPVEEAVDERLAVDRQRHRLAHALVVERLLVVAHVDLAVRGGAQLDDA